MGFGITSQQGLYALGSLIPFILLYLIRPRAREITIPSLLFFLRQEGRSRFSSFFRYFLKDVLFIFQFLTITALALSFANPFLEIDRDITASNVVIILDGSASSQALDGGKTRFQNGIDAVKNVLGKSNTIILSKEVPLVVAEDVSSSRAIKILQTLQPADTGSRIGDAMLLAAEALKQKGLIVVASDFINTAGQDPEIAKSLLESKGHEVKLINTASKKVKNIGIIKLELGPSESKVYIKNFWTEKEIFNLDVKGKKQKITLDPGAVEIVKISTPKGKVPVKIDVNDGLALDNEVIISGPDKTNIEVAIITNNESLFLKNALLASSTVDLKVNIPPVVNIGNPDIIILHNLKEEKILPGTLEEIKKKVKEGAHLIIHAQNNSDSVDYKGLLPLKITGYKRKGVITVNQKTAFTKDIDFGAVSKYFITDSVKGSVIAKIGETPVISVSSLGSGKVVYYGIIEEASDFKFSPEYPIFWHELINSLVDRKTVESLNQPTGKNIVLTNEQTVKTPRGDELTTSNLVLELEGEYQIGNDKINAIFLNELESDINSKESVGQKSTEFKLSPVTEQRKIPLNSWLFFAAAAILLLEFGYIKMRGDL